MYVAQRLVFTELHKTGGTHIGKWLDRFVNGEQVGKHNRIPPELWERFVIGSIRNPWDWYVSLWAYGCGGQGSVYQQTTRRIDFGYLSRQLHSEMGIRRTSPVFYARQLWHDFFKPVGKWKATYQDYNDVNAFRDWLHLLLNHERRFDFGEGYGFSPIANQYGLLTYRFMKLFSRLNEELYCNPALAEFESLHEIWEKYSLVDFVIRMESLEDDFIMALTKAGVSLSAEDKSAVMAAKHKKTNTSKRRLSNYYFDRNSIDLVAKSEEFIIEMFAYQPPDI